MDIRRRVQIGGIKKTSSGGGSTTGGSYTVDLNGQWEATTAVPNPDSTLYDGVYRSSSNYNVNNGVAIMYITIKDCSFFKMYIRSYAESNYDYVMVSQLDKTITGNTSYSDTTLVKAHTRGNQQSGTALSNYTLVEFTGITSGEHTITVVYRKDGSVNNDDDRGYVLISKSNESSGGGNSGGSATDRYMTILALEDGLTASLSTNACQYCIDGDGNWINLPAGTTTQSINSGQKLSFKGNLTPTSSGIGRFTINKKCNLEGNCMSMLFGDSAANTKSLRGYNYAFRYLFEDCTTIEEVSDTFLPATTLSSGCYEKMFYRCTKLIKAPKLPALSVPYRGYWQMFDGCEQLDNAPELPAKSLGKNCYNYMFHGCKSLLTAPELPATTISEGCYHAMFENCVNLTTPPSILPSYNMGAYCYQNMFRGCVSLMSTPKILAESLNTYCFESMFEGCISLTSAPDLLVDSVSFYSYRKMFKGCSNLNYIKMLATKISETDLTDWVLDVSNTGVFVKHPDMSSLPTGTSGIPSGWTVYNNGEEPEQELPQVAGDVAYYTNGEIKTISASKWNISLGTPIGVVVIPSNFLPDGKARIVSLKAVDSSGNATTSHSYIYWEQSGNYVDTTLTNYIKVPITNNTGSVSSSSNSTGYLPSDNFTGNTSFVDGRAKYGTTNTTKIPSPYNASEFNTDYSKKISDNNALSDFNGLSNTQVLVGLGSDYVAANAAYNYSDGASNIQWYLPAMGELGFLVARLKTINSTISQLGGVAVPSDYFWSSTEYSSNYAYNVYTNDGYVYNYNKGRYDYVRPFAMI